MKSRLVGFFIFLAILLAMVVVVSGATLPGTIIISEIVPGGDDANAYSIGNTKWMQGTMKQVPDTATRDLISADRRAEGMMCYVTGETNLYALVGGTNNANWMLWAAGTNSGGSTIVAAGTNIVVTVAGSTYTVSVADPLLEMEVDAGTLVVTNPISLLIVTNLQSFTNLLGDVVVSNRMSATGQVTFNGTFQLLTPTVVFPNAFLGTDGGQDVVSYTIGLGLTLNGGTISNTYGNTTVSNFVETNIFQTIHVETNFFDTVYVTNKLELLYLTANTAIKADANRDLASIAAAEGALTNRGSGPPSFGAVANNQLQNSSVTVNGTATHITTTSASIALGGSATLDTGSDIPLLSGNQTWTGSNHINGPWTFSVAANNTTPDMAVPTSTLVTNNAFTFLAPTHVSGAVQEDQWILIHITNSAALAKLITSPSPSTTIGTPYVTNTTDVYVNVLHSTDSAETNFYYIPKK